MQSQDTGPVTSAAALAAPADGSGQMFDAIAGRYDLLNRLISLGIDQRWRRKTVESLSLREGHVALDLATGTADLAILIAQTHPGVQVLGVDPAEKMLAIGRTKIARRILDERIQLICGVAEHLPLADDSVDAISMAFGIRNVPDRVAALAEMARVARPRGKIAILELSEPRGGLLGPLARFHIHTMVPWLGGLLSGSREYRYLQRSIEAFPSPGEFAELMARAGLRVLHVHRLTFGVCHLYVAEPACSS